MFRQWPVIYITPSEMDSVKPDANNYYRFATTFLTFLTDIGPQDIQTSHGVITLNEEYTGQKLSHNDSIMVLARCI